MTLSKIEHAVRDLQRGKLIIVVDDENRENEGDLVLAAEKVTPSKINFMIKKGGGLICVPLKEDKLNELNLPLMVTDDDNTEITKCRFTVSVDLKNNGTGISAQNRADTIKALIDPNKAENDFSKPGHIFPLMYTEGGVLNREGHTEAAIDLCKIADLKEAAIICEILTDDGNTAKLPFLLEFSKKHNLSIISIADLIKFINNN